MHMRDDIASARQATGSADAVMDELHLMQRNFRDLLGALKDMQVRLRERALAQQSAAPQVAADAAARGNVVPLRRPSRHASARRDGDPEMPRPDPGG